MISDLFTHGNGLGRGYGACLTLPWELTSKHGGGMSNSPIPPLPREHCVSLSREESGNKKQKRKTTTNTTTTTTTTKHLWSGWGKSKQCLSPFDLLFSSNN